MKVKKIPYKDPIYGEIFLTLIDTIVEVNEEEGVKRTNEIYEMPSGDFRVLSTIEFSKVNIEPFVQEFFFKRDWIKAIFEHKTKK